MSKQQLDAMEMSEERALVTAALDDRVARAKLRKAAQVLVARIASLYVRHGIRKSARTMIATAMGQFDALLNEYANQASKRRQPPERFSFVLTWWSTRRIEQLLRDERTSTGRKKPHPKVG